MEKNRVFCWNEDAKEAFEQLKMSLTTSPILAYPDPGSMFILDTDASYHGIGSVLSQVQDGEERVIAYFSRTLSKPKRRYCATRKELLAIIVSVKNFHHYLFGRKFLVRTDHGALQWLMKFKNPEGQTARWLEILGTYDFDIQHWLGRYHGNCDGLSRRPCEETECDQCARIQKYEAETVVHIPKRLPREETNGRAVKTAEKELSGDKKVVYAIPPCTETPWIESMSVEEMRRAQLEDPIIGEFIQMKEKNAVRPTWEEVAPLGNKFKGYWTHWDMFRFCDGVLHKDWVEDGAGRRTLLVLPEKFRNGALRELHDARVAGHLGQAKTLSRVRERFYWLGHHKDVIEWCKSCIVCVKKGKPQLSQRAPMKIYNVGAPLERIVLDILGPFPESKRGNKLVLCIGDYFTRWVTAVALPDPYPYPYPYPYPGAKLRTHTRTHGLEPVPIPMTRWHVGPVPIPIPMGSYPYPYPYPWARTRTRTHTHGLVPLPKVTFTVQIKWARGYFPFLVLHTISYIVSYMLWGKGGWKIRNWNMTKFPNTHPTSFSFNMTWLSKGEKNNFHIILTTKVLHRNLITNLVQKF